VSQSEIEVRHLATVDLSRYTSTKHLGVARRVATDYDYTYIPVLDTVQNRNLTAPPLPKKIVDAIKKHYREKKYDRFEPRSGAGSLRAGL
jgi:hypothetical protein